MTRRAADHAREIAAKEKTAPLRRRLLDELRIQMLTTSQLAERMDVHDESVSRVITKLREEGLIGTDTDPNDRRERPHFLTPAGEIELSRHHAYGGPGRSPVVSPSHRQRVAFLYSALKAAVLMRQETNQLQDAATRISIVLREARKINDGGLVIEAINELATTLRQIPAGDKEIRPLLDELEAISLGNSPFTKPTLVMPAIAHREYSLGRLGENSDNEGTRRARHLIGATNLYAQLAADPYHLEPSNWKERQGWGLIALARNLRGQSMFEAALEEAAKALHLFEEIENPYGRSHCHYVFGDCLRLLGDFDGAWEWLKDGRALAEEHCYERFKAELLMQMGEVLRCRGKFDEAQAALEESRDLADAMGLQVTQSFAHSALGAVAFHRRDLDTSRAELTQALQGFKRLRHRQGLALNARRRGAVERLIFSETKRNAESAERMIEVARSQYEKLASPAGVAACDIERGRLRMAREEDPSETVENFLDLIDNRTPEKNMVELDPWVPAVMGVFAEETEVEVFISKSTSLMEAARRRLSERARAGVQKAAELIGRNDHQSGPISAGAGPADEMAGETRQAAWALT